MGLDGFIYSLFGDDIIYNAAFKKLLFSLTMCTNKRTCIGPDKSKIFFIYFIYLFLFLYQTLWCDHSLESSSKDDSNGGLAIWLRNK